MRVHNGYENVGNLEKGISNWGGKNQAHIPRLFSSKRSMSNEGTQKETEG